MIIAIASIKGGVGKSSLVQNMAVYLQEHHGRSVMIFDCDSQRTTMEWKEERDDNTDLQAIRCLPGYTKSIRDELLEQEKGCDVIIVDCAGQDSTVSMAAMTAATHILFPFRPKRRDLKTLPMIEDRLEQIRIVNPEVKVASVITQCPSLPSMVDRILGAKDACRSFEITPLDTNIYNREIYDDADEAGSSVFELSAGQSGEKAQSEIKSLVREFLNIG